MEHLSADISTDIEDVSPPLTLTSVGKVLMNRYKHGSIKAVEIERGLGLLYIGRNAING